MLINKLLSPFNKNLEKTEFLEKVNLYSLGFISLLCFYFIEMNKEFMFEKLFPYFLLYIIMDTLFIPYQRVDMFLHHYVTIHLLILIAVLNKEELHQIATIPLLKTEYSSFFLALSQILRKEKQQKSMIFNVTNCFLYITFFKYRIIELSMCFFDILYSNDVYEIVNSNTLYLIGISLISILLALNYFWFYKLSTILFNYYLKKKKQKKNE